MILLILSIIYVVSVVINLYYFAADEYELDDYTSKELSEIFFFIFFPVINSLSAQILISESIKNMKNEK